MKSVLGYDYGYTGPGTTWANEMNFIMNHVLGAGMIAQPVFQQSSGLTLYHGRPFCMTMTDENRTQDLACIHKKRDIYNGRKREQ